MLQKSVLFSADFTNEVLKKIAKHIGDEWRRLGILLGLQPPQIDQIQQKHKNNPLHINFCILQVNAKYSSLTGMALTILFSIDQATFVDIH